MESLFILFLIGLANSEIILNASDLMDIRDQVEVVDFRGEEAHDLDGFIQGSLAVPDTMDEKTEDNLRSLAGKGLTVVYVVDGGQDAAQEAEEVLKKYGINKLKCYLEGISSWTKVGGQIEFPRFIKFKALKESLARNSILLIDVRNRTELNGVGQIPGSVCLPLHEVDLGFELSDADFSQRYGFLKPDAQSRNVILTCRSGRRVLVADAILKAKGYQNLRIYSGSFKDWIKNNGQTIQGEFDLDYEILS